MNPDPVSILLVDGQPSRLLSYEAMLGELGENLIKAGSAREALDHLLKNEIAVVLMDVSMPDMDGFELAEIIRGHPRYQKTAIIFVSAMHHTDLDRLKGYQTGTVDYVSVPVVPELLRAKVGVFTELYRRTREAERLTCELEKCFADRAAESARSPETVAEAATTESRSILVVDDNHDAADSLVMLMKKRGFDARVAYDGSTALELAETVKPSVVLLDIGLPGMDGCEVCRQLRERGLTDARIIAITGYGQDADRERSREAGFDVHAVKPVKFNELLKLIADN